MKGRRPSPLARKRWKKPVWGCMSESGLVRGSMWNALMFDHVYVFVFAKEVVKLLLAVLVRRVDRMVVGRGKCVLVVFCLWGRHGCVRRILGWV